MLSSFPQIDHSTAGRTKRVTISGPTLEAVQAAVDGINSLMAADAVPGSVEVVDTVDCPASMVGRIIGRGGETIRSLEKASRAQLKVSQVCSDLRTDRRADKVTGIINRRADQIDR